MRNDPFLEERHLALRDRARRLAVEKLEPLDEDAERGDVAGAARNAVRAMAAEGILRAAVPQDFGGDTPEVEARALVAAREGVAYGSGLSDALLALQGLGSIPIASAGSDAQKRAWLPKVAAGEAIAAFAMTEPDAGSDPASMTTTATRIGDGYEVNGTKTFISNAGIAAYYCLFAKTDPAAGAKGVSAFVVPADAPGIEVAPMTLMAAHPIGTVHLRKVKIPADAILGREGEGFKIALATLDRMRPTVAAAACGMAERALDEAVRRAKSRVQGGGPIADHQGLRWRLGEAATELEAARLLVRKAAWLKDLGQERITVEAAMAKLFATEMAQRVVDLALQIHGGSGTVAGAPVERLYREVRALRIYEGTSEVLRDIVGRSLVAPRGPG